MDSQDLTEMLTESTRSSKLRFGPFRRQGSTRNDLLLAQTSQNESGIPFGINLEGISMIWLGFTSEC